MFFITLFIMAAASFWILAPAAIILMLINRHINKKNDKHSSNDNPSEYNPQHNEHKPKHQAPLPWTLP